MAPTERGAFTLGAHLDQVFVMRFWQEFDSKGTAEPNRWRVRIRHVNSRRQSHAVGLEQAFRIVRNTLMAENASDGKEKP